MLLKHPGRWQMAAQGVILLNACQLFPSTAIGVVSKLEGVVLASPASWLDLRSLDGNSA